jgi:hypothetical protein
VPGEDPRASMLVDDPLMRPRLLIAKGFESRQPTADDPDGHVYF